MDCAPDPGATFWGNCDRKPRIAVVSFSQVLGDRTGESDERAARRLVSGPKRRLTFGCLRATATATAIASRHGEVVLRHHLRHRRLASSRALLSRRLSA